MESIGGARVGCCEGGEKSAMMRYAGIREERGKRERKLCWEVENEKRIKEGGEGKNKVLVDC